MALKPDTQVREDSQACWCERPANPEHIDALGAHISGLPDAEEAFLLIDLLRAMRAINSDDCMDLLRTYFARNQ